MTKYISSINLTNVRLNEQVYSELFHKPEDSKMVDVGIGVISRELRMPGQA